MSPYLIQIISSLVETRAGNRLQKESIPRRWESRVDSKGWDRSHQEELTPHSEIFFSSTKLIYECLSKSNFGLASVVRTSQDRLGSVNSRGVRGRDDASPVIDLSVSSSPRTQTSQWQSSTGLDWDKKIGPGIFGVQAAHHHQWWKEYWKTYSSKCTITFQKM